MIPARVSRIVQVVFQGSALDAATAAGVLPSTLTRIMNGAVTSPRVTTVLALADAYGVSFGWLIGELSTASAQAAERPLAEPHWLIRSYFRNRQKADREWLKSIADGNGAGITREGREIVNRLSNFYLIPDGEHSPIGRLLRGTVDFSTDGGHSELEIFRSSAVLETEMLKAAVMKLKKMGVRATATEKGSRGRK